AARPGLPHHSRTATAGMAGQRAYLCRRRGGTSERRACRGTIMSRRLAAVLLAALLTACGAANGGIAPRSGAPPAPIETAEVEAAAAAQPAAPEPTATVEPVVLPTPRPLQQTAEPTPEDPWLTGEVRVFPGPRHFVGDLITVEADVVNADQLDRPPQAVLSVDGSRLDAEPFIALSPLRDHA